MCRADACKCNSKWFEVWICVTTSIRIVNLQTQRQNMLGPQVTGEMMRDAWACRGSCKQLLKGFGGKRLPWWKARKRNLQSAGTDTESEYVSYIRYICMLYAVHCKKTDSDSDILCFLCLSLSLRWDYCLNGSEGLGSFVLQAVSLWDVSFALQVFHQPTSQWFEIHDLRVWNLQEKILLPSFHLIREDRVARRFLWKMTSFYKSCLRQLEYFSSLLAVWIAWTCDIIIVIIIIIIIIIIIVQSRQAIHLPVKLPQTTFPTFFLLVNYFYAHPLHSPQPANCACAFSILSLSQVTPVLPQMVALTESYIQVYQRQENLCVRLYELSILPTCCSAYVFLVSCF